MAGAAILIVWLMSACLSLDRLKNMPVIGSEALRSRSILGARYSVDQLCTNRKFLTAEHQHLPALL